jgi:predicted DNA binding CopG/RHH family protein
MPKKPLPSVTNDEELAAFMEQDFSDYLDGRHLQKAQFTLAHSKNTLPCTAFFGFL